MATTRIIAMHVNDGHSIEDCLALRTEYAVDPQKTEGSRYISSYACEPQTAAKQFMLTKEQYAHRTGRFQKNDVIAYQVRQSFKPGEITPEEANRVGHEFARRFLKGRHAFVVATHTDKEHIHNHIIWNSTSLDARRKWRDFLGSGRAVSRLSDLICIQHNLSVIDSPQHRHLSYNKWLGDKAKPTQRDMIRAEIDSLLSSEPTTFEDLLARLSSKGFEVRRRGKNISVRCPGGKGYIRLSSLDQNGAYNEISLSAVIAGSRTHTPISKNRNPENHISLVVDIQKKMSEGKGAGYERWAKIFNLKQMAQTVSFLSARNLLNYSDLETAAKAASEKFNQLSEHLKRSEKRLAEIAVLQRHIINYAKTKATSDEYKKSGYSRKFFDEHESDIALHRASKKAFNEMQIKKLPPITELKAEYTSILEEKKKAYSEYLSAKTEQRALLTAKANVDALLGKDSASLHKYISEEHK